MSVRDSVYVIGECWLTHFSQRKCTALEGFGRQCVEVVLICLFLMEPYL